MDKLSSLPNIGKTIETKLNAAGIFTREELAKCGSRAAFTRIRTADPQACYSMLCAIEGAIQGVRWHDLPAAAKDELKRFFDA